MILKLFIREQTLSWGVFQKPSKHFKLKVVFIQNDNKLKFKLFVSKQRLKYNRPVLSVRAINSKRLFLKF